MSEITLSTLLSLSIDTDLKLISENEENEASPKHLMVNPSRNNTKHPHHSLIVERRCRAPNLFIAAHSQSSGPEILSRYIYTRCKAAEFLRLPGKYAARATSSSSEPACRSDSQDSGLCHNPTLVPEAKLKPRFRRKTRSKCYWSIT